MFGKIVQLNEEVIKVQIRKLVRGSMEDTLKSDFLKSYIVRNDIS